VIYTAFAECFIDDVDVLEHPNLERLRVTESVYGGTKVEMWCRFSHPGIWDTVLKDETTQARLRWGLDIGGKENWAEWRTLMFPKSLLKIGQGFTRLHARGTDLGWRLAESCRGKAYRNKRVSTIVEEIAEHHGLETDVKQTEGTFTLYQCSMSDADFLLLELLPRAVSVDGRTDFFFFIKRGKVLVFKPLDISEVKAELVFGVGTDVDREFPNFVIQDRRSDMSGVGAVSTEFRRFHPLTKQFLKREASDSTISYEKLAMHTMPVPGSPTKVCLLSEPGPNVTHTKYFDNMAKARWGRFMRSRYVLKVTTTPRLDVEPGDVVSLDTKDDKGKDLAASGKYFVSEVRQTMIGSAMESNLTLQRRTSR